MKDSNQNKDMQYVELVYARISTKQQNLERQERSIF